MDIKHIQPEATVTFEMVPLAGVIEPQFMTFTVRFISLDEIEDEIPNIKGFKISVAMRALLKRAIVGWDLKDNGVEIPCDMESKAKYLPIILGLQVKPKEGDPGINDVLVRKLVNFAGDINNFLKN